MLSLGSKSHPTPRTARRTNASLIKQMDSEPTSVSRRRNEPPRAGGAAESSRAAVKPPTQRLAPRLCCALNGKTAQRETIPSSTRLAHTARRPKPRKAALIVSGAIKRPQPHEGRRTSSWLRGQPPTAPAQTALSKLDEAADRSRGAVAKPPIQPERSASRPVRPTDARFLNPSTGEAGGQFGAWCYDD